MKTFKHFIEESTQIDEAGQPEWTVAFKKQTLNGIKVGEDPVRVKARDAREALLKAAKKVGITDKSQAMQLKTKDVKKQE